MTRTIRPLFATLASTVVLFGCAVATPYQPSGFTGGYSEAPLSEHSYKVVFGGNGHASAERIWSFWIYRCAELTREKGYAAFAVLPPERKPAKKAEAAPSPSIPGPTITRYSAGGTIVFFNPPYPAEQRNLLDAQKILETLKPYVESDGQAPVPVRRDVVHAAMIDPPA